MNAYWDLPTTAELGQPNFAFVMDHGSRSRSTVAGNIYAAKANWKKISIPSSSREVCVCARVPLVCMRSCVATGDLGNLAKIK